MPFGRLLGVLHHIFPTPCIHSRAAISAPVGGAAGSEDCSLATTAPSLTKPELLFAGGDDFKP